MLTYSDLIFLHFDVMQRTLSTYYEVSLYVAKVIADFINSLLKLLRRMMALETMRIIYAFFTECHVNQRNGNY